MIVNKSENLNFSRTATGVVLIDHKNEKVLLVTSLKFPGLWVLPKGGLEDGLTAEENAQKETREEAGIAVQLHGKIYDEVLHYPATGDREEKIQREIYFRGSFLSYVDWEEYQLRKREWFTIDAGLSSLMNSEQYEVVKLAKVAALLEHAQSQGYSA
jgi:diphosphoinositol-polyphosphate diphosphatase